MPIHKLSKERAIAKNIDSFGSMTFELSKSLQMGLLNTLEEVDFFFNASKHIYVPINTRITVPINLVMKTGKIAWIIFPKNMDKYVINVEITNSIIFPINDIFVFCIPYVIPIPSESMLLEIASKIEFNIITPLKHNMTNYSKKLLHFYVKYDIKLKIL